MNLQKYVTSLIEAAGGVVEDVDYALCEAVLPPERADLFSGKTELLLAFDYEVAMENPDAEFVTYGSYLLEKLIAYARNQAKFLIQYALVEHPDPANAKEKLERHFFAKNRTAHETVRIDSQRKVYSMHALFEFTADFRTDEPFRQDIPVWIDMARGCLETDMDSGEMICSEKPQYDRPATFSPLEPAIRLAKSEADRQARSILESLGGKEMLQREQKRIGEYYDQMLLENRKLFNRKGVTPERKEKILFKENAIQSEKERQLKETQERYQYSAETELARVTVYFVPETLYEIRIVRPWETVREKAFYNPILHQFEESGEEKKENSPVRSEKE